MPASPPDLPAPPSLPPARSSSVLTAKVAPRRGLVLLVWGLLGVAAALFGLPHLSALALSHPPDSARWWAYAPLLALPLLWLVVVATHEIGHLLGGFLRGGKFTLLSVGPFMLRRTPRGLRLAFNFHFNPFGGLAICLPDQPSRFGPRQGLWLLLGGPFASLLFAVACLLTAIALRDTPDPAPSVVVFLQHSLSLLAVLSAYVTVQTLTPSTTGGLKSDGRRILDLLRGGPRVRQEHALLSLSSLAHAGVRPSAYPADWVDDALSLNDDSLYDLYARVTVYYHAADLGDWPRALQLLRRALARERLMAPYLRDVLRCEFAWLIATAWPTSAPLARRWLDAAGPLAFEPSTRLRAEAAVLLVENRPVEAAALARKTLRSLETTSLAAVPCPFSREAAESILQRTTP